MILIFYDNSSKRLTWRRALVLVCKLLRNTSFNCITGTYITVNPQKEIIIPHSGKGTKGTHVKDTKNHRQIAVSGFSRCPITCILTHSESHNGLARARNTNLSTLVSKTMRYQPILIELLTVLFLLQQHIHFSSSRCDSMRTLSSRNVGDDDLYETRDCSKSSSQPFEKFVLRIVREICSVVPKWFVPFGTEIWATGVNFF